MFVGVHDMAQTICSLLEFRTPVRYLSDPVQAFNHTLSAVILFVQDIQLLTHLLKDVVCGTDSILLRQINLNGICTL